MGICFYMVTIFEIEMLLFVPRVVALEPNVDKGSSDRPSERIADRAADGRTGFERHGVRLRQFDAEIAPKPGDPDRNKPLLPGRYPDERLRVLWDHDAAVSDLIGGERSRAGPRAWPGPAVDHDRDFFQGGSIPRIDDAEFQSGFLPVTRIRALVGGSWASRAIRLTL
jgi:hypothetical protein